MPRSTAPSSTCDPDVCYAKNYIPSLSLDYVLGQLLGFDISYKRRALTVILPSGCAKTAKAVTQTFKCLVDVRGYMYSNGLGAF